MLPKAIKPIVTARVVGGLGNQMFIYATAKALAQRLSATLKLDIGGLQRDPLRSFALDSFKISDICYIESRWVNKVRQLVAQHAPSALLQSFSPSLLATKSFEVEPRYFAAKGSCFLYGYWQSYKYFSDYAQDIRQIFSLERFISPRTAPLLSKVTNSQSVSVHFRRGDYVTNEKTLAVHGLCEMDYYDRARKLIERIAPESRFYIFSDDHKQARESFSHWPNVVFVEGYSQMEDMALMSFCSHHIIANSSFSWWAAWLDSSPDPLVIAPKEWFSRDTMRKAYVLDLFPPEWILL